MNDEDDDVDDNDDVTATIAASPSSTSLSKCGTILNDSWYQSQERRSVPEPASRSEEATLSRHRGLRAVQIYSTFRQDIL
ncbi:hypothetical protein ElyMa_002013400 [Elysia marginata]|uniref:Uncharacterized protein n=1 Tax=Elysia marginata TaxID=1093978 RepID=A0AAV4F3R6_9GAST|nr:hypothetical protein ElyMa_002013400 [Elysia marginata]